MATQNLMLGDCLKWMKSLPDKYYDLAIVDPPYGISEDWHRENNRSKLAKTRKYHKALWDQSKPDKSYFIELERVSKNQIILGGNHLADLIGKFSPCWLVWNKINGETNFADCELAYTSFDTAVRMFSFMWNGMLQGDPSDGTKMQGNKKRNQERIHPTEKPIPLYKWLLTNYAKEGQKIFDSHGGSFSHAIAAYDLGFDLDIIEIDPDYFRDGKERYDKHVLKCEEIKQLGFAKTELSKTNPTLF